MRGRFDASVDAEQWCERGLLARIHRRTIKRLRARVQPVSAAGFMRFLLHWHGVGDAADKVTGADSLAGVIAQLEGVEVPGAAWEREVLPLRIAGYLGHWLDGLCAGGQVRWARLSPPVQNKNGGKNVGKSSLKIAPIALLRRRAMSHWLSQADAFDDTKMSAHACRVVAIIRDNGAQFYDDLLDAGGWLKSELEIALAELAAHGVIASDSFCGLRALVGAPKKSSRRRRYASPVSDLERAGRWFLLRDKSPADDGNPDRWAAVEYIAGVLLRRYGVVFRALLQAENNLPAWRDLHYVYRRMEARGEVRGGRFVGGFAGEQFALPEAVAVLRRHERDADDSLISISAADPLNLTGVILPGARTPATAKNRILLRGGIPVATLTAGKTIYLAEVSEREQWRVQQKLIAPPVTIKANGKFRFRQAVMSR